MQSADQNPEYRIFPLHSGCAAEYHVAIPTFPENACYWGAQSWAARNTAAASDYS